MVSFRVSAMNPLKFKNKSPTKISDRSTGERAKGIRMFNFKNIYNSTNMNKWISGNKNIEKKLY